MDEPESLPRALVLVVDDDVKAGRVLVRMLREDGFDAELAPDGAAAIGRLARNPLPDILVTDLRMPHADGGAIAQFAQSRKPHLPVVLITGYPQLAAQIQEQLEPRASVFVKPIDYPALARELSETARALNRRPGPT